MLGFVWFTAIPITKRDLWLWLSKLSSIGQLKSDEGFFYNLQPSILLIDSGGGGSSSSSGPSYLHLSLSFASLSSIVIISIIKDIKSSFLLNS